MFTLTNRYNIFTEGIDVVLLYYNNYKCITGHNYFFMTFQYVSRWFNRLEDIINIQQNNFIGWKFLLFFFFFIIYTDHSAMTGWWNGG